MYEANFGKFSCFAICILVLLSCSRQRRLDLYDSNDVLKYRWFYEDDTLTGRRLTFWPDGQLREVHNFKNGKLNGEYRAYYLNGHVARKSQFYNGIIRGPALRFFENPDSAVQMETYFLDVSGAQYVYYNKKFDNSGSLIDEERTVRLDFDCSNDKNLAHVSFIEHFSYDSVYIISGGFAPNFAVDNAQLMDTLRISKLPASLATDFNKDNWIRGKCIFFVGTNAADTNLVDIRIRWFEENLPETCRD